jgi:hypothetical protein
MAVIHLMESANNLLLTREQEPMHQLSLRFQASIAIS